MIILDLRKPFFDTLDTLKLSIFLEIIFMETDKQFTDTIYDYQRDTN